jgi:hypothetical protein
MSNTNYSKSSHVSSGSAQKVSGGGDSGGNNGPTGSARSYPKGRGSEHRTDWNPMKKPASTYGVKGCC